MLILIGGLDECEGADAQCKIIKIIVGAAREGVAPFCWAFFSRPEPHIEAAFARPDVSALCHKTMLPTSRGADAETGLYLWAGFENILRRRNISIGFPWPSNDEVRLLVDASDGLFTYPATLLRFVAQPNLDLRNHYVQFLPSSQTVLATFPATQPLNLPSQSWMHFTR